jgi:predicted signal transduction protein with EAL and GGDEF domain
MQKLRISIVNLLIFIIILFNIERLDIGSQKNVINFETGFYVMVVVAILMILSIRRLQTLPQHPLIALTIGAFLIVKLVLTRDHPLLGGMYTYLSITELGLFIVAVLLAQNLALNIKDFEQAVENFAFANIRKVKPVQEAYEEIQDEIYRSRRFQRSLSIVVLEQDLGKIQKNINKVVQDAQRMLMDQYTSLMIARELATQLRRTDLLLENGKKGGLVILSPDTDKANSELLIERLKSVAQSEEFPINFGVAIFPDHALTFEQLVEHAEMDLLQRINSPIGANSLKEVEVSKKVQTLYVDR